MRLDVKGFLAVFALSMLAATPGFAQSDTRGLVDRLDRMERDLTTLQSQVYRSQGGSSVITSPSASGGAQGQGSSMPAPLSGDAYSSLDRRLSSLEAQLRDVTGQVERTNFTANQLSAKIDRMQADFDLRLKEIEQKSSGASEEGGQKTGANAPANGNSAGPGAPPGNLVHPGTGNAAAATKAPAGPALVGKTPQEQYDYAFGLLRNSDYDGASRAFEAFLGQHPQDPLAGNATYWLAQIPYTQRQWDKAAPLFLNAYSKYPKSAKASESLLKLGLSMSNLGKTKEACAALTRFSSEYPDAADSLRRTAASEKTKLKC